MSKHRIRKRNPRPAAQQRESPRTEIVADMAQELLTLWRAMPYAVARDQAGQLSRDQAGDRHASGAAKGSAASVNLEVVDAAVVVETGIVQFAAEAVRLLNLDRRHRDVRDMIEAIPEWHRALAAAGQPLAGYIERDLKSWLRQVREAIRVQKPDMPLGPMCPDHRDTTPGKLLVIGASAQLAASLLAGPPDELRLLAGPVCNDDEDGNSCWHPSCIAIQDRRLVDHRGRPLDWVLRACEPAWSSSVGDLAWTWRESGTVRCPRCKRTWSTLIERRMLARELAALGDKRPQELAT